MRRTNKKHVKQTKRQIKRGKRTMGKFVSRKRRSRRAKKIFSLTERTTEPNIMVNHTNSGGILSGLRTFLSEKNM